jgi:hypothetical protein
MEPTLFSLLPPVKLNRMRFRKLRIAWSVAWCMVAVLLCVLWVRSYFQTDFVTSVNKSRMATTLGSTSGAVYFARSDGSPLQFKTRNGGFAVVTAVETKGWKYASDKPARLESMFLWKVVGKDLMIQIPIWLSAIPLATLAAAPWIRYRFSLRTLLIATTLVAVALGLAGYVMRR